MPASFGSDFGLALNASAGGQQQQQQQHHLTWHKPLDSKRTSEPAERLQEHPAASQHRQQRRPHTHAAGRHLSAFERSPANGSELSQVLQRNDTFATPFSGPESLFDGHQQEAQNQQQQRHQQQHSILSNTGLPFDRPHSHGQSSEPMQGLECFGDLTSGSITSFSHCNSTSNSQLLLMNISTQDLSFSSIQEVWYVKSWQEILLRVSMAAPIVLLGLMGNLTIIYWMCRFKPIRSRPTNIFILNMALADLLTSVFCPNAALLTDIFQFYVLGAFVCRFEGFVKITWLLVSAYSLIVLSFDWFLCVVKPCRRRITIKQSWLTLAAIWLLSIVAASPLLYWRNLRERQWKDLVEVWCCEHIQYTKYYWVCMTLFLIYLPTFIMTIVLVVILVQMDKFEAKLKRSRRNTSARSLSSASISTDLTQMAASASSASLASLGPPPNGCGSLSNSLSISIKYRRRIVKILFFYLLTSIVCWTPLQFVIVYRHFRAEAVPADWFFELAFWSQLCASLSAALNPIIFGFLSQPFRRIVTKSWMFRFCDNFCRRTAAARNQTNKENGKAHQLATMNRGADRHADKNHHHNGALARHHLTGARSGHRTGPPDADQPKLTIDYIDPQQMSGRIVTSASSNKRISTISGGQASRQRTWDAGSHHQHQHQHHQRHNQHRHHQQQRQANVEHASQSMSANREASWRAKVERSHSSRHAHAITANNELSTPISKRVPLRKRTAPVAPLTNGSTEDAHGAAGKENGAYLRDELDLGDHEMEVRREEFTSGHS